jgi:hypothetical protein
MVRRSTPAGKAATNTLTNFYRAQMRQATPSWFEKDLVAQVYEACAKRTAAEGVPYHVDHIVPKTSDFVCGLHCLANLAIISGVANIRKNNRWWPDMWDTSAAPRFLVVEQAELRRNARTTQVPIKRPAAGPQVSF